ELGGGVVRPGPGGPVAHRPGQLLGRAVAPPLAGSGSSCGSCSVAAPAPRGRCAVRAGLPPTQRSAAAQLRARRTGMAIPHGSRPGSALDRRRGRGTIGGGRRTAAAADRPRTSASAVRAAEARPAAQLPGSAADLGDTPMQRNAAGILVLMLNLSVGA